MKSLILIFFVFHIQLLSASELELEITTSKNNFLTAEPIEVGITLLNTGNQVIKTKYPHPAIGTLKLEIIDYAGNIVPFTGFYACGGENNIELQPNEEFYQLFVLDELYGLEYSKEIPNRSIEPGIYSIQALYKDGDINIVSNKLQIEIIPPTGNELNVYNEFLQIVNNPENRKKTNVPGSCNSLLNLVERYPSSVYNPVILVRLKVLYKIVLNDKASSDQIGKKLLEEYPGSGKCQNYIANILDSMSSKSDKINFLQKVKTQSKGSLMEKIYDKKMSEIN